MKTYEAELSVEIKKGDDILSCLNSKKCWETLIAITAKKHEKNFI